MQKKIIIAVVGSLGFLMVLLFDGMSQNTDNHQGKTVKTGDLAPVEQQEKKVLSLYEDSLSKANLLDSSPTLAPLPNDNKKKLLTHSAPQANKRTIETSSIPSEHKLELAMQAIPINYHSVLYWKGGQDQDVINEYSEVTENIEPQASELVDTNLEVSLSNFIYQHELNTHISLEYLDCTQAGCIMYGVELQSGIWSQLIELAKNQSWWTFSQTTTRSSVGTDGNLIFFTVLR
jgi:hypothetical protein